MKKEYLIKPFRTSLGSFADKDPVYTEELAKAIYDMKNDDVLREYQYFVGGAGGAEVVIDAVLPQRGVALPLAMYA